MNQAEMNNNKITRRGLILGGLALMAAGCSPTGRQALIPISSAFTGRRVLDPRYRRRHVRYDGSETAGTIVVNTSEKFLYSIEEGGWATRYGVGVGEQGLLAQGICNHWPQGRVAFVDTHRQHDEAQTPAGAVCRRGSRRTEQSPWCACALSLPRQQRHDVPSARHKRAVDNRHGGVERMHSPDKRRRYSPLRAHPRGDDGVGYLIAASLRSPTCVGRLSTRSR